MEMVEEDGINPLTWITHICDQENVRIRDGQLMVMKLKVW